MATANRVCDPAAQLAVENVSDHVPSPLAVPYPSRASAGAAGYDPVNRTTAP